MFPPRSRAFAESGGDFKSKTNRRNKRKARWVFEAVLAGLMLALGGCSQFNPAGVRAKMTSQVKQNKFQEARDLEVKGYPPGVLKKSSEETMKESLIRSLVEPAEAAFTAARIRALESQVPSALKQGDDEAAREAICGYGVTDQPAVNMVTYLAKCAYLNSRVNPATLSKWERFAKKYVDGCIQSGDFDKATAAAKRIAQVPAYPVEIDDWMDRAGDAAIDQRADAEGVGDLLQARKEALYTLIASRAGFPKGRNQNWDDLVERLASLEGLEVPYNGFEKGFEPVWRELEAHLRKFRQSLVDDDVSASDADTITRALLNGFKALVADERTGLTTLELNKRLADLQSASLASVQDAVNRELAKAEAAQRRELEKLWNTLIGQLASSIDLVARENAFIAAISDRVAPEINCLLGEGARALRLYRANGKMAKEQATSLLLASLYMGFDDTENLAMGFGADINGRSDKDALGRTPYLLSLQYGFKGQAETLLASADTSLRDAKGYGAVHYAVRGNDTSRLLALLRAHGDARRAASDGTTPLMLAARLNNGTTTRMLLGSSDLDAKDSNGYAAIHIAAENGNLDIVQALVAAGAATGTTTGQGAGLLELAASANAEEFIAYLLDDLKVEVGERPVSWCVIHGKVLPLKTLVAHGGKLTDRHLAAAAKCGHLDMVKYLVEQGCDVNSPDVHGVIGGGAKSTIICIPRDTGMDRGAARGGEPMTPALPPPTRRRAKETGG